MELFETMALDIYKALDGANIFKVGSYTVKIQPPTNMITARLMIY